MDIAKAVPKGNIQLFSNLETGIKSDNDQNQEFMSADGLLEDQNKVARFAF
jgi:hypothetical protein